MTQLYQRIVLRKGDVMYFPNLYIVECLSAAFFFLAVVLATWHMRPFPTRDQPIPPALAMGSLHFRWSGSTSLDHQGSHLLLLNVDHYLIVSFVKFLFSSKLCSYQFILRRVLRSVMFFLWIRGQQTFSGKTQIENILGFAGNTVSCN